LEEVEPSMEPPRRPITDPPANGRPPARALAEGERWRKSVAPVTKWRLLAIVALFGLLLVVNFTCQKHQVRLTKAQAISLARPYAGFTPQRTQERLIRQGLKSRPYWAISFSIPDKKGGYLRVTTIRVDANTGKVAAVNREKGPQSSGLP
jgi:hypothetical protein